MNTLVMKCRRLLARMLLPVLLATPVTVPAADVSQMPLYLTISATPLMMLTMSRDEQLFIKAYPDYTDLDGDGLLDTTYQDKFDYSGYFDSRLCYTYDTSKKVFKAAKVATAAREGDTPHQCDNTVGTKNYWSGNFLNWLSMSRMDMLRYVLYGGLRSTDSSSRTVLERAHIPNDLHAWAKVYAKDDINKFAPYTYSSLTAPAVSFCNASFSTSGDPIIRKATGFFPEWASTAGQQCGWQASSAPSDGNTDYYDVPNKTSAAGVEFVARVEVCDPNAATPELRESFCKQYGTSYKPTGLLQAYGEPGSDGSAPRLRFGLLTGSFANPRSGGILRRNIGQLAGNTGTKTSGCAAGDEINTSTGQFCNQGDGVEGIINTMNRFKIANNLATWDPTKGTAAWSDCGTYGIHNRTGGNGHLNNPGSTSNAYKCSAWGNPLSEIYAEVLRYIAADSGGKTDGFNSGDDLTGLPEPDWSDPYAKTNNPWCARCSVLVLSSGLSSFDSDEIPKINAFSNTAADATKKLGALEGIDGSGDKKYLVGRVLDKQDDLKVGTAVNTHEDLCKASAVGDLSLVRGLCPDIPSQEGSFLLAGLAWQARTQDVRPSLTKPADKPTLVNTYSVALAENLPKFEIPIGSQKITLTPLCQANNTGSATAGSSGWRSCYLGNVTIGEKKASVGGSSAYIYGRALEDNGSAGSFSLVWEDSQWGSDHDNDVVSMITYCVGRQCERTTGTRKGTAASLTADYSGYDICWRSNSSVCGSDGKPTINSDDVLVRIENLSAYAGNAMLTGYAVSGSSSSAGSGYASDGLQRVALRPGDQNDSVLTQHANPPTGWARPSVLKFKAGTSDVRQLQNPLWYAAKYGGFTTLDKTKALDPIAQGQLSWSKDGVTPDSFFKATNPAQLKASLNSVFTDVLSRSSSSAAIATNSTRLDTASLIFQAKFNSSDWSGQMLAYKIDPKTGGVGATAWDTDKIDPNEDGQRASRVWTWNDSSRAGAAFTWSNLSVNQQTALKAGASDAVGQDRVSWLLGSSVTGMRARNKWLGDIVNSDPFFVGQVNFGYDALPDDAEGKSTYRTFRSTARTKAIYFGANDGMLHALNAVNGHELFAYVPGSIYGKLAQLSTPNYQHQFLVDGSPNVGDAYFDGDWHAVLVGTTGAGGQAVFALDVTDPTRFDGGKVLWEINSQTRCADDQAGDPGCFADLGYTIGQASIGRMKDGTWVAIFGNGYKSANKKAMLYIVNAQTGALIKTISTCVRVDCPTAENGLSTPALLVDASRTIIAAYAGDLQGNLWKFDFSSEHREDWEVAFSAGTIKYPLVSASTDGSKPITAPLEIGLNPAGGYMVYFGTGKYYETGDNIVGTNPTVQSFYGVWDNGNRIESFDTLQKQTVLVEESRQYTDNNGTSDTEDDKTLTYNLRAISKIDVPYSATATDTKRGWYLELRSPIDGAQGERVVSVPRLRNGRVIFTTLIPSTVPCDSGGTSWLMEIDALNGSRIDMAVFDLDNNHLFNQGDYMIVDGVPVPPSGMQSQVGIIKTPAVITAGEVEYKYAGGSADGMMIVTEKPGATSGRQSWRQVH